MNKEDAKTSDVPLDQVHFGKMHGYFERRVGFIHIISLNKNEDFYIKRIC